MKAIGLCCSIGKFRLYGSNHSLKDSVQEYFRGHSVVSCRVTIFVRDDPLRIIFGASRDFPKGLASAGV
jgi:hypothetical protein